MKYQWEYYLDGEVLEFFLRRDTLDMQSTYLFYHTNKQFWSGDGVILHNGKWIRKDSSELKDYYVTSTLVLFLSHLLNK